MYTADKSRIKREDIRLIKDLIAEEFGLVIDESKERYLCREIESRLKKLMFRNFSEYYAFLKYDAVKNESRAIVSLLTNNETSFFREELQLRVFAENILPLLKKEKISAGTRKLTVLSAGCSSGEEVYTLAMLLLESGLFVWDWDIKVIGIDVDGDALEKANKAIYSGRAFQSTPQHFVDRYFRQCHDGFCVRDVVRDITTFVRGNLLDLRQTVAEYQIDVIFCRNVLIYFSDETIKQVVRSFSDVLVKEGLLFLGHSESLARITDDYLPLRFPGSIIYKKRDGHK